LPERALLAVILVGPSQVYKLPSQAAKVARDGDTIRIEARHYRGDFATWRANRLTITGIGGRPTLDATNVAIPNRKAIWVVTGRETRVENIEFVGAHDRAAMDRNWAGIRQEGSTLTVRNCVFRKNDNGILTGDDDRSIIIVSGSEFDSNGYGDGYSHNMYVGRVRSFTLSYSLSHNVDTGHLVKSRARSNQILYNRLLDGESGTASYELNLPNGGAGYVIGNMIQQGRNGQNSTMLCYGEEGALNPVQALYVVNNTFVNDLRRGTFVSVSGNPGEVRLVNNIFTGGGKVIAGSGTLTTNLETAAPKFVDPNRFDYRLTSSSPAINAATAPGSARGIDLTPMYQFDGRRWVDRPKNGNLDIGAYEY
jgi:hypothetical protein